MLYQKGNYEVRKINRLSYLVFGLNFSNINGLLLIEISKK
jgi:hypothetical protein